MQKVNLLTVHTNLATPLVHLVIVLQPHGKHAVIIEVFLHHHQIVVFLRQIFADARRAGITRAVGIDFHY